MGAQQAGQMVRRPVPERLEGAGQLRRKAVAQHAGEPDLQPTREKISRGVGVAPVWQGTG